MGQPAPGMICSRLNRLYLNQRLIQIGAQTAIWPTLVHVSDHAPVYMRIQPRRQNITRSPAVYHALLTDEAERLLLIAEWHKTIGANTNRSWNARFAGSLKAIKLYSDQKLAARKAQRKETYEAQFAPIFEAELALQSDWNNQLARDQLNEAQIALHIIRQQQLEAKHDRNMSEWTRIADRCNREFFEHHNGLKKLSPIRELVDTGRALKEPEEMQNMYIHITRGSIHGMTWLKPMIELNRTVFQVSQDV